MRHPLPSTTQISRRTFAKGTLAALVGLGLSTGSAAAAEGSADLVTGPDEEPIGSVSISESDGSLAVTYAFDDDEYDITETHLHVAESVDGIPTNKPGNPKVGHFDHSSEHEEGTDSVEYEIDVSDLGDELVVAAQAKVRTEVEEGETPEEEAADGDEEPSDEDGEIEALDTEVDDDDSEDGEDAGDEEPENGEADEDEDDDGDDEEEEPEYEYESAWADGERISQRRHPRHGHYLGSWATYVTYERAAAESGETDE